jgi:hypothetical protein
MTAKFPIVLAAPIVGHSKGKVLEAPYRAILKQVDGHLIFVVEQGIKGEFYPTGGQWRLSTLLANPDRDSISIDFGQDWSATGLRDALAEALTHI